MPTEPSVTKPFGDIALCLSGGGYRAATYALGTLAMLDELELLDDVKLLSTVSGGTFTGLIYATWQSEGKTFAEFYKDFSHYLKTTNAIDKALDDLYTTPSPSGSTDLSLIRSAARSYQQSLLGVRSFQQLLDAVEAPGGGRFRELIFNATEFREGNSFRFRASSDKTVFIGNQNFAVPKEVAGEIHLADIVAASSCFPGAFEPLRFPDDFYWQSPLSTIRAELLKEVENPVTHERYQNGFNVDGKCIPLPLMDGGIYDNQGISNAVMADRNNSFGLFLITDTSPRDEDILNQPDASPRRGWVSLGTLFWCAVGLFIVCLLAIGIIGYSFFNEGRPHRFAPWQIILAYVVAISPAFLLIAVLAWIHDQFRRFETLNISGAKFRLWHYFKKMALPDAIEIVKARVNSVLAMTSNVFMKRIRQLQFNNLMNPEARAKLVSFNLIYSLNPTVDRLWLWKLDPELEPTLAMKEISAKAEIVPTTLWMNEEQFKILTECGRATACFSLLKYLWQRWVEEEKEAQKHKPPFEVPKPDTPESPYYEIYTRLKAKWLELKKEFGSV
jgi:predicted acylesterase/phospholipase RssA